MAQTITEVRAELAAFQQQVVDEALRLQHRHNLCGVVDRTLVKLGLGDLMPHKFRVQIKQSSRGRWKSTGYGADFNTRAQALTRARTRRSAAVSEARWRHGYNWNEEHDNGPREGLPRVLDRNNVSELLAKVTAFKARVDDAAPLPEKPKFVAPDYPIYRAVEIDGAGTVVAVLGTD